MAKLVTLTHLETLGNKVKESCASKTEFNALKEAAQTAEQVKAIIAQEAAKFAQPSFKKVDKLPDYADAEEGVFYLIKENSKYWSIYAKVDGETALIKLDETEIDLDSYTTDAELENALKSYVKTADLNTTLGNYAAKTDIANFVTSSQVDSQIDTKLTAVNTKIEGKVDKVTGKQLSTEDFTTALKNKLEALPEGIGIADDQEVKNSIDGIFSEA